MIALYTERKSSLQLSVDKPLELRGLQNSFMEEGMLCRGQGQKGCPKKGMRRKPWGTPTGSQ